LDLKARQSCCIEFCRQWKVQDNFGLRKGSSPGRNVVGLKESGLGRMRYLPSGAKKVRRGR
jgi:hypothetical protein